MGTAGYIIPVGDIEKKLLEDLAASLGAKFPLPFKIEKSIAIPVQAFDPGREQYDASIILGRLAAFRPPAPGDYKVLGVIDKDLYARGLNFVFGQAEKPGRHALISLTRLRPSFYGRPENAALFFERAGKEAVHELGHTFGLDHCPDRECVMFFSNTIDDTDRKSASFCEKCLKRL